MTKGGYLPCPGMWTFVYAHKQPTEPTYILHGFIINASTNEPHFPYTGIHVHTLAPPPTKYKIVRVTTFDTTIRITRN